MKLYCRKCEISGKGINKGYFIEDNWYGKKYMADNIAHTYGFTSWEGFYNCGDIDTYWEHLNPLVELLKGETEFYLKDGTKVIVKIDN